MKRRVSDMTKTARQTYREQHSRSYLLRDIPSELWNRARHRAIDEGMSLRELIFVSIQHYLEKP